MIVRMLRLASVMISVQGMTTCTTHRRAAAKLIATVVLSSPAISIAAADCEADCLSNCERVAPKNIDYCRSRCTDYCEQTDRRDGLSGSVSDDRGYVGLSSPLRGGGTVEFGADNPPALPTFLQDIFPAAGLDAKPRR